MFKIPKKKVWREYFFKSGTLNNSLATHAQKKIIVNQFHPLKSIQTVHWHPLNCNQSFGNLFEMKEVKIKKCTRTLVVERGT